MPQETSISQAKQTRVVQVARDSGSGSRRSSSDSTGSGRGTSVSARPEEVVVLRPVIDYQGLTSKWKNDDRNFVVS